LRAEGDLLRQARAQSGNSLRGYNILVPPSTPRPSANTRKGNSRILRAEATGIILIALLILVITVVRYWRNIPWGAG
jgi:hypothetical protein